MLQTRQEIGNRKGEASTRHELARIALKRGDYAEAEEEFEEVLKVRREIGDRSGEAGARHSLATIALGRGNYAEARRKFEEVLQIYQEVGDRPGEATTFGQLGNVADKLNHTKGALQLHLLAFLILNSIEHRHQQTAWTHVSSLASDLGLSQDELEEIAEKVAESYAEDRGWSLIQEAFPDADRPDDIPPTE